MITRFQKLKRNRIRQNLSKIEETKVWFKSENKFGSISSDSIIYICSFISIFDLLHFGDCSKILNLMRIRFLKHLKFIHFDGDDLKKNPQVLLHIAKQTLQIKTLTMILKITTNDQSDLKY